MAVVESDAAEGETPPTGVKMKPLGEHWSDRKKSFLELFNNADRLSPIQKPIAKLIGKRAGHVPQPLIMHSFKKRMFGQWHSKYMQRSMRESKFWTSTETELMAAFTAQQLGCSY